MEKEIIDYLVKRFNPVAVILHGSRATEYAKPHSDWDIYVFVSDDISGREFVGERYMEQSLDTSLIRFPVDDEVIKDKLVAVSSTAKVVFDTDGEGEAMLERARNIRSQGRNLTQKEIENKKLFMMRCMDRLRDSVDNDAFFSYRLGRDFVRIAIHNWFVLLHNEYDVPIYMSLPRIQKDDSEYYRELSKLWSRESNEVKLEAAEYIFKRLFSNQPS